MSTLSVKLTTNQKIHFDELQKKSGFTKSEFIRARILSNPISEKELYQKCSGMRKAILDVYKDLSDKKMDMDKEVFDNFIKAVNELCSP